MENKLFVWQMIKESVDSLGGNATYSQIKEYIRKKYGDVNESTITAQTVVCTVNHTSRIHYPENKKPRIANSRYDFLFTVGRGQVTLYDSKKHGIWEIREEQGILTVAQKDNNSGVNEIDEEMLSEEENLAFPFESHLRDFIAKNIESIKVNGKYLKLYTDSTGRDGVEYPTDVGFIDILARDEDQDFVIFELKLSKGGDKTLGQILRYMGWIKKHLAQDVGVKGVIVAQSISEQLKYAVSLVPDISLFEYAISFNIQPVSLQTN